MSKFDEIRQAYVDARKVFFDHRDASAVLALSLVEGMERYLGCPQFYIHFLINARQATAAAAHDAKSAVVYGNDGLWHFTVCMDVIDNADGFRKNAARQTLMFELLVQPQDPGFSVGLKGWNDRFVVPAPGDSPESTRFYDFWFKRILDSYVQPGHRFFEDMADSDRTVHG
jgi:hypothetical protein